MRLNPPPSQKSVRRNGHRQLRGISTNSFPKGNKSFSKRTSRRPFVWVAIYERHSLGRIYTWSLGYWIFQLKNFWKHWTSRKLLKLTDRWTSLGGEIVILDRMSIIGPKWLWKLHYESFVKSSIQLLVTSAQIEFLAATMNSTIVKFLTLNCELDRSRGNWHLFPIDKIQLITSLAHGITRVRTWKLFSQDMRWRCEVICEQWLEVLARIV